MAEGYEQDIVSRLKGVLRSVTLKLMALFLFVIAVFGGVTAVLLYKFTPKALENDKGKPVVWKIALIASAVGLVAGGVAYWYKMI